MTHFVPPSEKRRNMVVPTNSPSMAMPSEELVIVHVESGRTLSTKTLTVTVHKASGALVLRLNLSLLGVGVRDVIVGTGKNVGGHDEDSLLPDEKNY